MYFLKKGCLIVLFFICLVTVSAQKVAVVLSGGGAKGVTHIGVLQALEENGIPIDYIAGTSMGAIIGGLYASGYSPAQMLQIINSQEFTKWVSGKLDEQYTYFFRKSQPDPSWLNFKFRYDSTLQTQFPTNIISPLRMDFAFLELFSEASAVSDYDFNKLMVPFRCVASDIRNNSQYILKQGDLGTAIRASMTFPFYFKPIRIDGHLLFDGGMYNNFPSDVVLEDFSPDIIIGSKASANYPPPSEDDVVSQLKAMLMDETKYNVYCDASVLIEPELETVNLTDFSHTDAFIDSGYVATMRLIPEIRLFVLDTVTQAMHDSIRKRFNDRKPEIKINSIEIKGLQPGQASYIANAVMGQAKEHRSNTNYSRDLDLDDLKSGYFKIVGEDRLKSVYPSLFYDSISRHYKFIIDAKYDKNIIADFGGSLSSSGTNEIFLQLRYGIWRKVAATAKVNGTFGRFYNSALAGGRIEFPGRKPKFLELEYTFNQFNFFRTTTFFFTNSTPSFLYENNNYVRLDAGFPVTYRGKLELGINAGSNRADYFHTNTATIDDKEDRTVFNFYSPYIELEFNTLNRKQYSNHGYRIFSSLQFVGGLEKHTPGTTSELQGKYSKYHNYFIARFNYDKYFRPASMYKPGISFEFQANTLDSFRNYTATTLYMPAFAPVYEMPTIYQPDYRPSGFASIGMRNIFTVNKNMDFRIEGFVMAPFRELTSKAKQQVVYSNLFPALHYVLSGSFVYTTPIGPLSVSLNYYDIQTPASFYISIGYIIFNRSAF